MKRTTLLAFTVPAFAGFLAFFPLENQKDKFHTEAVLAFFLMHGISPGKVTRLQETLLLPIDSNILFPTAKTCGG